MTVLVEHIIIPIILLIHCEHFAHNSLLFTGYYDSSEPVNSTVGMQLFFSLAEQGSFTTQNT